MSNQNDSTSTTAVALNRDIISDILLRLPGKSLDKFKCMSRGMFSLISGCEFSRMYYNCHLNDPALLFSDHPFSLKQIPILHESKCWEMTPATSPADFFRLPNQSTSCQILGSCNGMLLCLLSCVRTDFDMVYCVCNPFTKVLTPIPPPGLIVNETILGMSVAFDPSHSPHFKVICVCRTLLPRERKHDFVTMVVSQGVPWSYSIEIFSSLTWRWEKLHGVFWYGDEVVFEHGVYWNGSIHWPSVNTQGHTVYFNTHELRMDYVVMPNPRGIDEFILRNYRYLEESSGYLHLIDVVPIANKPIVIYEMIRIESETYQWALKYRVNLGSIENSLLHMPAPNMDIGGDGDDDDGGNGEGTGRTRRFSVGGEYHVLSLFRDNDDGNKLELVLSIPGLLISYNIKDNTSRVILNLENEDRGAWMQYSWYKVFKMAPILQSFARSDCGSTAGD